MIHAETLQDLIELSMEHPYYCSESNYYSNDGAWVCDTLEAFLDEWENFDPDYNHVFRWDVTRYETSGEVEGMVFFMLQRKGLFRPCTIKDMTKGDVKRFVAFLNKHEQTVKKLWNMP